MKNRIKFVSLFVLILLTGCYDREVIDSKEFGFSLPDVENLNYTKQGNSVRLTWQMPAAIPATFKRPVEVSIQIVENDIYRNIIKTGENTSVDISIDVNKSYRFVVKLSGYLTEEAQEEGKTDRVYSKGKIVKVS